MPNVELLPYRRPSMWRRMSFANWADSTDPQVYGRMEVDMSAALQFAAAQSERSGTKVTPTHLVVRATALALKKFPEANALIRWRRVYQRKDVDIFCQVAIPGEKPDLSGAIIRNADRKGAGELARELAEAAGRVRTGTDVEFARSRKTLDRVPAFLGRIVMALAGFVGYTLNINLRRFGMPRDPFGGAMVTSVGSLGIQEAYPPLVPMSHTPLLVSVGRVEDRPVVRDGQIVVRPVCILTATFDHRVMDGFLAGKLAGFVTAYLENPETIERE